MQKFNGKTAYIFGGSSGIGLETGKLLAAAGARVFIFARTTEKLQAAEEAISACASGENRGFGSLSVDVTDHEGVNAAIENAIDRFGIPDLLINSAGRGSAYHFEDIRYAEFDRTMKINLYGTWNTVSALVGRMQPGSHIVNVASIAGFVGVFGFTGYTAAKFGVIGFSEALRSELKPRGIGVSVLCPPDTDTPGFHEENLTKPEETKEICANARLMQPDQVARVLVRGLQKNRFMIIPGFDGKLTYFAKRLLPGLVAALMDRDVKKVQRTNKNHRMSNNKH
ncbi:MAG: SDR family oxidoreductase [Desulfobacterales bacterium]|nr:SDR family oxidoreductase [Desulfobacterales bacterium]